MLNMNLGIALNRDGRDGIQTMVGRPGHALFGPYQQVEPGRYSVEFLLRLADDSSRIDDSAVVARLDVSGEFGQRVIALDHVTAGDVRRGAPLRLEFDLDQSMTLEYRVYVSGIQALFVADAHPLALRGDDRPAAGPRWAEDPHQQHKAVREVLRLLRPHRVVGHDKIRVGNVADGGYVMIDDFDGVDTALSLGINDDITWDVAAAARGLKIYQFDHTVSDPAPDDDRMEFSPTMIAAHTGEGCVSLEDLVQRHHRGGARQNLLLKMDIENWEWAAIETLEQVGAFSQIVCEMHYFQGLADPMHRHRVRACLEKLHAHYVVAHIHANNFGGVSHIAGVTLPNVVEVTFANRSRYQIEETDELFPHPLDAPCDPNRADIWLGGFRF